ncbi:MAG: ketopantoate reductase family protein [Caldilineaceae bacterium]|nr:ketopantoate reductase family protein [Caldilineaceae bacterium]
MRILVIGAGAIGCLVGGKLALAGENVTLVGRPHFAAAVADLGLRLRYGEDEQVIRTVNAAGSTRDAFAGGESYDLAILTVKSYDTATALDELTSAVSIEGRPVILSLQNGVGNEEAIAAAWGDGQVIAGTLTTPVSVQGPALIRIDRPSFTMGLSPWSSHTPAALVEAVHSAFLAAGFKAKRYSNAPGMKWTKLLMNMMGNATSAILDQPPARLFADARVVDLEIAAWREALAVMAAAQIPPVNLGSYPFAWLAPLIRRAPNALLRGILRRQVRGARGDKLPSLHIDLHQGKRKSEIGWLNGAVVVRGQEVGISTPINALLTDTVTALLADPQQQESWRGNVEKLVTGAQAYQHTKN